MKYFQGKIFRETRGRPILIAREALLSGSMFLSKTAGQEGRRGIIAIAK
jgi:hypothetical protein